MDTFNANRVLHYMAKGQLISKCLFGVIVSIKKPTDFFKDFCLMPGPCSGKKLISILVTDYIQKRRGQARLFSFEYNLLPNLISNF